MNGLGPKVVVVVDVIILNVTFIQHFLVHARKFIDRSVIIQIQKQKNIEFRSPLWSFGYCIVSPLPVEV